MVFNLFDLVASYQRHKKLVAFRKNSIKFTRFLFDRKCVFYMLTRASKLLKPVYYFSRFSNLIPPPQERCNNFRSLQFSCEERKRSLPYLPPNHTFFNHFSCTQHKARSKKNAHRVPQLRSTA